MKALVWQWGRRGAGPRYAAELAAGLRRLPDVSARLSLSDGAELLRSAVAPACDLPVRTYAGLPGFALRMASLPVMAPRLAGWLGRERVDVALCAMPAALDLGMAAALRLRAVPYAVVVHDADLHPGDRFPAQIGLQRLLLRGAAAAVALSGHVAGRLREQGLPPGCRLLRSALPPFGYGAPPAPAADGTMRLLSFGRLLPYKGLDLLDDALGRIGPAPPFTVRVVGSGPDSPVLDRLRRRPEVTVENRWVPEDEVGSLFAWADAVVLSHREASQSGVAAAALTAGCAVVATSVGGLPEQLAGTDAVLCDPDPESVAAGLRTLLARPRSGRMRPGRDVWPETVQALAEDLRRLTGASAEGRRG